MPARASFIDAHLELNLFQHDLDAWKQELSGLAAGTGALFGGDRGLSLVLHKQGDRRWPWRSTIPAGSAQGCGSAPRRTESANTPPGWNRSGGHMAEQSRGRRPRYGHWAAPAQGFRSPARPAHRPWTAAPRNDPRRSEAP
ncbi:DUF5959 family protein [Actinacidiphila paucisporea]|uniref:DUF5959 family protein n=1 Tax=Actinacidiphila paucisporea TaxID=310782 RepID=UPI0038993266